MKLSEQTQFVDNKYFSGMLDFRLTVEIEAPPDRVWAVMREIERLPESQTNPDRLSLRGALSILRRSWPARLSKPV
jgi:hypothetical protein